MQRQVCFLFLALGGWLGAGLWSDVKAQDPHFSQFFASPLYLNPALTGTCDDGRFLFNYRTQWANLPGEFVTTTVSYDHPFPKKQSNLGAMAMLDRAGSAGVQSASFAATYAYNLILADNLALRFGGLVGYNNRSLNYLQLVFGDQLTPFGVSNNPTQEIGIENLNVHFLDIGFGTVLHSDKFWAGVSVRHLNQPTYSFGAANERLPMHIGIQGGYKFTLNSINLLGNGNGFPEPASIHPAFNFAMQGNFKRLDLGVNAYISPLLVGLWYRSVPISPNDAGAIAVICGFKYKIFNFLYSYDYPVGRLAVAGGGAHEIGISLNFDTRPDAKLYRKRKRIEIPKFPSLID